MGRSSGGRAPRERGGGGPASQAELLVVVLVFGLMWTCGGLALQTRVHEVRQLPSRDLTLAAPVWIEGADLGALPFEPPGNATEELGECPR